MKMALMKVLLALSIILAACAKTLPPTEVLVVATTTVSPMPVIATTTPRPTMTVTLAPPTLTPTVPQDDGYSWHGHWIPGIVSYETQHLSMPDVVVGIADSYAPGVMETVAINTGRSYGSEYIGAVALILCTDIGDTVWLRRPGGDFEGPYYVMDCARPIDIYGMIVYSGIVVEVDYNTAVRWGVFVVPGVVVSKLPPGQVNREPVNFRSWFLNNVTFEP